MATHSSGVTYDETIYWVNERDRAVPLLIRDETAEPEFAIVGDQLVPIDEWVASRKFTAGSGKGFTMQAQDGHGSFNIKVEAPVESL